MRIIRGLLFDLDGTLLDSKERFYESYGQALRDFGLPEITREAFERHFHLDELSHRLPEGRAFREDFWRRFLVNLTAANHETQFPIPGVPEALGRLVLAGRSPVVVAGTHGKTTTTALTAWLLEQAGLRPGFLVGGVPLDFGRSYGVSRVSGRFWTDRYWPVLIRPVARPGQYSGATLNRTLIQSSGIGKRRFVIRDASSAGEWTAFRGSTACSPSRSTIWPNVRCSWRAIGWG